MSSTHALLNGINLSDLNVYVVNVDTGLLTSPFLSDQEILEDYSINNDTPYFYGVKKNPLQLQVTFAKIDGFWTLDARREFARILDSDDYVEFLTTDAITKIYYVKYVGGIDLMHNGLEQGYLTVTFRCDSPYAYSPTYTAMYDFSNNINNEIIFDNIGDDVCTPEMWVEKIGNGSFEIKNNSNAGKSFVLSDLKDGEIIYINNYDGTIETDLPNTYRYSNHNGIYLELIRGRNVLKLTGTCNLKIKYNFKIIALPFSSYPCTISGEIRFNSSTI